VKHLIAKEVNRLHVLNFAVHPQHRRSGVGAAMITKLRSKLSPERRRRLLLEVRETNLAAQLFSRQMKFRAISVLRDFYDDTPEDAYLFEYLYNADGADGHSHPNTTPESLQVEIP